MLQGTQQLPEALEYCTEPNRIEIMQLHVR